MCTRSQAVNLCYAYVRFDSDVIESPIAVRCERDAERKAGAVKYMDINPLQYLTTCSRTDKEMATL